MPDDYKHRLGRKGILNILLSEKERPVDSSDEAQGQQQPAGMVLPGAVPDDEYVFMRSPMVVFLDLGTRLREGPGPLPATDYNRVRPFDATEKPVGPTGADGHEGWWNEYVEIELDELAQDPTVVDFAGTADHTPDPHATPGTLFPYLDYNTSSQGLNADLPEALQKSFDEHVLGSRARRQGDPEWRPLDELDPLAITKANGSKRPLFNCMPLPYRMDYVPVDMILTKKGTGEVTIWPISNVARQPVSKLGDIVRTGPLPLNERWDKRGTTEKDSLENWNPLNKLTFDNQADVALESGRFDGKGLGGAYHLKIASRLFYEPFDTQDTTQFKVTSTPYFEGPEVGFSFSPAQGAQVYLKPMWLCLAVRHRVTRRQNISYQSFRASFTYFSTLLGHTVFTFNDYITITFGQTNPAVLGQFFTPQVGNIVTKTWFVNVVVTALDEQGCSARADVSGSVNLTTVVTAGLDEWGLCRNVDATVPATPTLNLRIFASAFNGGNLVGQSQYGPAWLNFGKEIAASAEVPYGPFAFRVPVYFRPINGSWRNIWTNMDGQHNPAIVDHPGTQFGFNMNNPFLTKAIKQAFFRRKSQWQAQQTVQHLYGSSAQHTDQPVCRTAEGPDEATIIAPGDYTLLAAKHNDSMGQIINCFNAQPKIRNGAIVGVPTLTDAGSGPTEVSAVGGFEPRNKPAGLLCGVVKQGDKVHYIWRKLAQELTRADYMRDNINGSVS